MTNDETQRKMDFIVEQQAQFHAYRQQQRKEYAQAAKRFAKTEKIVTQIERAILKLKPKS